MEYAEDLLEDEDQPYSGLDRILFLSCRRCCRYTPFLIYISPGHLSPDLGIQTDVTRTEALLCCAECLPGSLNLQCPAIVNSLISDKAFLRTIQGFEYRNPFYRRYAQLHRTLITADTRLDFNAKDFEHLSVYERLHKLQELFPSIHLLQNKRYSGLAEINDTLKARNEIIQTHYRPELEAVGSPNNLSPSIASGSIPSPSVPVVVQNAQLKVLSSEDEHRCDICLLSEKNTIQFGPFIEKPFARDVVRCHYFCLLSGTYIQQRGGSDSAGVLRFLLHDVKQSMAQYREKPCHYCGQKSAPIKCNVSECDRFFHYICGFRRGCLTQFVGEFHSFCHEHLPFDQEERHHPEQQCWICWERLPAFNPMSNIHSVCEPDVSSDNPRIEYSWYHRDCLQKYAYEAGYYFKCPHCHEKDSFPNYARRRGIFVPMRDASWEIDRTYFKDLHGCSCSVEGCLFKGVKHLSGGKMAGCKVCGGETVHLKCAQVADAEDYVCSKCMDATFIQLF